MAQIAKHDSYAVDALGLRRVVRAGTQVPAGYTLIGAPAGEAVPQTPDQSVSAPAGTTPATPPTEPPSAPAVPSADPVDPATPPVPPAADPVAVPPADPQPAGRRSRRARS